MNAETQIKPKLVFKDLGEPAAVKLLPEGQTRLLLGTIVGIADGIKIAKGADGISEFKGLKGTFEGVPADTSKPITKSGVAFLGDAFQADIVALLEDEKGPDSVSFAYEVWVIRATNAAGYSWALVPKMQAAPNDPLAEMRKLVERPNVKALEAPVKK
jgi:hypothetical protein